MRKNAHTHEDESANLWGIFPAAVGRARVRSSKATHHRRAAAACTRHHTVAAFEPMKPIASSSGERFTCGQAGLPAAGRIGRSRQASSQPSVRRGSESFKAFLGPRYDRAPFNKRGGGGVEVIEPPAFALASPDDLAATQSSISPVNRGRDGFRRPASSIRCHSPREIRGGTEGSWSLDSPCKLGVA